jgi:hypothetical protein
LFIFMPVTLNINLPGSSSSVSQREAAGKDAEATDVILQPQTVEQTSRTGRSADVRLSADKVSAQKPKTVKYYVITHCRLNTEIIGIWKTIWDVLEQKLPGRNLCGSWCELRGFRLDEYAAALELWERHVGGGTPLISQA